MKLSEWIEKNSDLEIADIEALEKCFKKEPKTIWDIEIDNEYVYIRPTGKINYEKWDNEYFDENTRLAGNAFLTIEEAEREVKRRKIETLLLKYGGRREFKTNGENFYLAYCNSKIRLEWHVRSNCMANIYFESPEDAQKAIEAIGEQRIIDEYFKPYLEEDASK